MLPVKTAVPEIEEVQEVTPKKAAPKTESKPEPKKQAPSKPKVAPVVKAKQNTPEKPVVKAKKADIATAKKKKRSRILLKKVEKANSRIEKPIPQWLIVNVKLKNDARF